MKIKRTMAIGATKNKKMSRNAQPDTAKSKQTVKASKQQTTKPLINGIMRTIPIGGDPIAVVGAVYDGISYPIQYFPMGGCMPYPPFDCVRKEMIRYNSDNIPWIDNTLCETYCQGNLCERRKAYKAGAYEEYRMETKRLEAFSRIQRDRFGADIV